MLLTQYGLPVVQACTIGTVVDETVRDSRRLREIWRIIKRENPEVAALTMSLGQHITESAARRVYGFAVFIYDCLRLEAITIQAEKPSLLPKEIMTPEGLPIVTEGTKEEAMRLIVDGQLQRAIDIVAGENPWLGEILEMRRNNLIDTGYSETFAQLLTARPALSYYSLYLQARKNMPSPPTL